MLRDFYEMVMSDVTAILGLRCCARARGGCRRDVLQGSGDGVQGDDAAGAPPAGEVLRVRVPALPVRAREREEESGARDEPRPLVMSRRWTSRSAATGRAFERTFHKPTALFMFHFISRLK